MPDSSNDAWVKTWQRFLGDHITEDDVLGKDALTIAATYGLDEHSAWYIYGWYMYCSETFNANGRIDWEQEMSNLKDDKDKYNLAGWLDAKFYENLT